MVKLWFCLICGRVVAAPAEISQPLVGLCHEQPLRPLRESMIAAHGPIITEIPDPAKTAQ